MVVKRTEIQIRYNLHFTVALERFDLPGNVTRYVASVTRTLLRTRLFGVGDVTDNLILATTDYRGMISQYNREGTYVEEMTG